MERPVVPGHFMLPLPINKTININRDVVNVALRELCHDLKGRTGRPEELAIRNLQGLMSLRLGDYENALCHFKAILDLDSENLNALANLQYVTEKLFWMSDAQFYQKKLDTLMSANRNLEGPPFDKKKWRLRRARCLAEQAYAHACDIHIDRVGESRHIEANKIYEDALKLAGEDLDLLGKIGWKFCMAKNAHKVFNFLCYKEEYASAVGYLKTAESLFYEITQANPTDPEYQWESWRNLADIFRGIGKRWQFKSFVVHPELIEFKEHPRMCMEKAKAIAPKNAKLLARFANFLYSQSNKNTAEAMQMLEESIELDGSDTNFYAHSTKGTINFKNYKKQIRDSQSDAKLLENAKSNFEKALSMSVTPWDLANLGEVYHLLAKLPEMGGREVRKYLENALLYFTKAAECEDGKSRSDIHLKRGRCLFDMGEYVSAIGCFKQAIACEPKTSKFTGNFNELLQVYLCVLQGGTIPRQSVLPELVYNLKEAQIKYGRSNMETHCFKSNMREKYGAEIQVVTEYCKGFGDHRQLLQLLESKVARPFTPSPLPTGGSLAHHWRASLQAHQDTASAETNMCDIFPHQVRKAPHAAKHGDEDEINLTGAACFERQDGTEMGTKSQDGTDTSFTDSLQALRLEDSPNQSVDNIQQVRGARQKARVSGFKYDFYIVYSDGMRDWVVFNLLSELQNIWKLKGCTRHTHAIPGKLKLSEELKQMKESACILLVIGGNFLQSCDQMMHHALELRKHNNHLIIPVIYDDEPVPELLDRFNPFDARDQGKWKILATCIEQQIKPTA